MQLRYANNSNYKNDTMIRKEVFVSQPVLDELKRVIDDTEVGATAAAWHECHVDDSHVASPLAVPQGILPAFLILRDVPTPRPTDRGLLALMPDARTHAVAGAKSACPSCRSST